MPRFPVLSRARLIPALAAGAVLVAPIVAVGQRSIPGGDGPYSHQSAELDRTEAHLSARQISQYWSATFRTCMAMPPFGGHHDVECLRPERDLQEDALQKALQSKLASLSPAKREALKKDQQTWETAYAGVCVTHGHGMTAAAARIWCGMDHAIRRHAAIKRW